MRLLRLAVGLGPLGAAAALVACGSSDTFSSAPGSGGSGGSAESSGSGGSSGGDRGGGCAGISGPGGGAGGHSLGIAYPGAVSLIDTAISVSFESVGKGGADGRGSAAQKGVDGIAKVAEPS